MHDFFLLRETEKELIYLNSRLSLGLQRNICV